MEKEIPEKKTTSETKSNLYSRVAISLVFVLFVGVVTYYYAYFQAHHLSVELYGTSTNDATVQAETSLINLSKKLNSHLDYDIHLVTQEKDGQLVSYQPAEEKELAKLDLEENQRQLAIKKRYPQKFADYLLVHAKNPQDYDWKKYALMADIDPDKIEAMVEDGETVELQKDENQQFAEVKEKLPQEYIPVLFINGEPYQGRYDQFSLGAALAKKALRGNKSELKETPSISLFDNAVTLSLPGRKNINGLTECYSNLDCNDNPNKDGYCKDINTLNAFCKYTTPATVSMTVVSDDTCVSCHVDAAAAELKKDFKGLQYKEIDIDSPDGRKMIDSYNLQAVPAFIFDANVEDSQNFNSYFQNKLLTRLPDSDMYILTESEPRKLFDRPLAKNKLDIFVTSYSPLAIDLENKLLAYQNQLVKEGKPGVDLELKFILASETNEAGEEVLKLEALSKSAEELEENKRQAVIQKFFPDKLGAYLIERNKDIASGDWRAAAQKAGLDTVAVENLVANNGDQVLAENAELALEFGVTALPVFFWENQTLVLNLDDLKKINQFKNFPTP